MYVSITWGKIKPGKWDECQRFYAGRLQGTTRGLEGLVSLGSIRWSSERTRRA